MPKKKEESGALVGLDSALENKLTVQKSNPLLSLWRSKLTLAEFKILDTYLSRIDSHHPEKRTVVFDKGELESLLGVKFIRYEELKKRIVHLMGNVVEIRDPDLPRQVEFITLFDNAVCEKDDFGVWQVRLRCSELAMKYCFNIENLGYLRYKLKSVLSITSRYSYLLFLYLEFNRFQTSWEVDLGELKEVLGCQNARAYDRYKVFNDAILKPCRKELESKTECRFTYSTVKRGRTVVALRFTLDPIPEKYNVPPPVFDGARLNGQRLSMIEVMQYYGDACKMPESDDCEFTPKEMMLLYQTATAVPKDRLPLTDGDDWQLRLYHYLAQRYFDMDRRDTPKGKIKNRFGYLLAMVQQDTKVQEDRSGYADQEPGSGMRQYILALQNERIKEYGQ